MSYRVRGLGMDRELERKIAEKYSLEDENEIVEWIIAVLTDADCPDIVYPEGEGTEHFHQWLKDGTVLCQLMNVLMKDTSIPKCKPHKLDHITLKAMRSSKEQENISMFLTAAEKYGVCTRDLFQTVCLYEKTNLPQVHVTLFKLGSAAQKHDFQGPIIGVKVADKNERKFCDDQLREGRSIIGLQMGTNQVASQQGMTPYGLGRQLVYK